MLQHFVNLMVFVDQKVILSSPMLNSFANFWKHVFNMLAHIGLAIHDLLFGLNKYLINEALALNHCLEHFISGVMRLYEVYNDVIRERKMFKHILSKEFTYVRYL
jgi:hypothetical protein